MMAGWLFDWAKWGLDGTEKVRIGQFIDWLADQFVR